MALRIKYLRKDRGLSQAQLAEMVGMERSQLSKIEREVEPANTRRLAAIAQALEVQVHDLFVDDGSGNGYKAAILKIIEELDDSGRDAILSHAEALASKRKLHSQ